MHVDPNSPRATLTQRQQQVLERLERGEQVKKIARDVGISRAAVYQHIERLRRQGALAESYTPSGQPPRRAPDEGAARVSATTAPRESNLAELRRLGRDGGAEAEYAAAIEGAIASADAVALGYELGRLDALAKAGLPRELVESALRRLSVLPPSEANPK